MSVRERINIPEEELAEICRRYHVKELALFGSILREDFREDSDIDLLVEFEPGATVGLFQFASLKGELSDLLAFDVDLVSKGGLHARIREVVLRAAHPIYTLVDGVQPPPADVQASDSIDRDLLRLHVALESCQAIEDFVAEVDSSLNRADHLLRNAILYELTRLAEAIRQFSPEFKQNHPNLPCQAVIDAGTDSIERYFDIDWERVWTVVIDVVPQLRSKLAAAVADTDKASFLDDSEEQTFLTYR